MPSQHAKMARMSACCFQSPLLPGSMAVQRISIPTILPSNIQVLTVASVICDDACKYPEISARPRSPGTSYENEDCFKSWIASLVSASSNIELNTMRTSSCAEKAGICSVKSKRHVIGRCRGIPAIYTTGMKRFWKPKRQKVLLRL